MAEAKIDRSGSWRATSKVLLNQFISENVLVYNGHAFNITRDFLSYVDTLVRNEVTEITILDNSGIPCNIEDTAEFFKQLLSKHLEAAQTLAQAWAARQNDL